MDEPDVSIDDFQTLAHGYGAFCDHVVVEDHQQIAFTLQPINWDRALLKALFFSAAWAALVYLSWLSQRGNVAYLQLGLMGAVICGWPIYVPLIRRLLVSVPFLRIDKREYTAQVGSGEPFAASAIIAVCDVVGSDNEGLPTNCELQVLVRENDTTHFVLVAASLGDASLSYFEPFARDLAERLEVRHLSANLLHRSLETN